MMVIAIYTLQVQNQHEVKNSNIAVHMHVVSLSGWKLVSWLDFVICVILACKFSGIIFHALRFLLLQHGVLIHI